MSLKRKRSLSLLLSLAAVSGWAGTAHSQVWKAWVAVYDGPGMANDAPSDLAVDREGNVLVTGFSNFSGNPSASAFATVKFSPEGGVLWVASYGNILRKNEAKALAVDADGNVHVTGGTSTGSAGNSDYATVKYSPEGKELWAQLYVGPAGKSDIPSAIAVDAAGNVYVTGTSYGSGATDSDYATVKYSPDGKELWIRRYNGPAADADFAADIAIDGTGNVLVTGTSDGGSDSNSDYATVKYSADGMELWVRRYSGPDDSSDAAKAIAIDAAGNVVVTGGSSRDIGSTSDYATVKYSPDGEELWVMRYPEPGGSFDWATAIAIDAAGNVIITGQSQLGADTGQDYATVKYGPDGKEIWAKRYTGAGDGSDKPTAVAIDAAGNVYVTGNSSGGSETRSDFATVKYSPGGEELWVDRYDGPGSKEDTVCGIAVDASGNLLVAGQSAGIGGNRDYAALKLDPDGKRLWIQTYSGPGSQNEQAMALALDGAGNVLVTGESLGPGTDLDYATVKYAPDGTEVWARRWNGPAGGDDQPAGIAVDANGNALVTGKSAGDAASGLDYATVKYAPDGTELWIQRYNGTGDLDDIPKGIAVDAAGNVYVTGESAGGPETELDFATVKYGPGGQELWARRWSGAGNGKDRPCGMAVDAAGNVHVAGESIGATTSQDYTTVKYGPDGTELWVRHFNGPEVFGDTPRGIAIDAAGNVYVTGESRSRGNASWDYATVKYSPAGEELWVQRYSGPANGTDKPGGIVLDAGGNVHVTGMSFGGATGTDWATVKYDPDGNELWVDRLPALGTTGGIPPSITLDGAGNVLVAGGAAEAGANTIVKYDPQGRLLWIKPLLASIAAISADTEGGIYVTGRLDSNYATFKYETVPLKRGTIDADDKVDITDAIVLLQYLFLGGDAPQCLDAADVDDSGELNVTDPIRLLSHLFLGGIAPEEPFTQCGRDITLDSIECNVHPSCDPFGGIPAFTFYGREFRADGVFYVVDKSGSMHDSGELIIAKREILRNIDEFPESMEFGIAFFDSSVEKFPETGLPAKASPEMKAGAKTFVQSIAGGFGSCCQQGLAAGLQCANQSAGKRKVLLYVADGGGTCQGADEAIYLRQTLAAITAMNDQGVQIHCFGVLNPSSLGVDFMKRLAEANGGTYTRVIR
jgi:uncharacterized delta-60 repeat protein